MLLLLHPDSGVGHAQRIEAIFLAAAERKGVIASLRCLLLSRLARMAYPKAVYGTKC